MGLFFIVGMCFICLNKYFPSYRYTEFFFYSFYLGFIAWLVGVYSILESDKIKCTHENRRRLHRTTKKTDLLQTANPQVMEVAGTVRTEKVNLKKYRK
jgi:hypothetical protein